MGLHVGLGDRFGWGWINDRYFDRHLKRHAASALVVFDAPARVVDHDLIVSRGQIRSASIRAARAAPSASTGPYCGRAFRTATIASAIM
jgi:hypothetical protein